MLAIAEASWAGICDFMILGSAKAAMIRMIVTTMISSISEKPRSRLRLRILFTSLVSLQRSQPQNTVSDSALAEKAAVLREADKQNYSSVGQQCQRSPVGWTCAIGKSPRTRTIFQQASESRVI